MEFSSGPLLLNDVALPMEPPKILQGKREGGKEGQPLHRALQPWEGLDAFPLECSKSPLYQHQASPFHPKLWMLCLGISPAISSVPNEVFMNRTLPTSQEKLGLRQETL